MDADEKNLKERIILENKLADAKAQFEKDLI